MKSAPHGFLFLLGWVIIAACIVAAIPTLFNSSAGQNVMVALALAITGIVLGSLLIAIDKIIGLLVDVRTELRHSQEVKVPVRPVDLRQS